LLLCGDTLRSHLPRNATHDHPVDVGNLLLFGDAGSAALLVHDAAAAPLHFLLGSDGQGAGNLLVRAGATRCPSTAATQTLSARDDGVFRSDEHILLNGPEIFSFTLREVAPLATGTLQAAGWTLEDTDAVVMHQANTFMLKHLGKRLKIPEHKLVIEMARWGNTSSASIPLAMVAALANRLRTQPMKLLLCGFGVGYSWAGLALQSTAMTVPDLIEVSDDFAHAV
jgi:3-oxoacyl-[acyl-carrier-protein] synthase-3